MNKHNFRLIFFFLAILFSALQLHSQEAVKSEVIENIEGKEYYIHTVEQGQTLYALSRLYDVPLDELIFENPEAGEGLSVGQLLRIPMVSRDKVISGELRDPGFRFIFHIVKQGETLYAIARIYDVAVADLKTANPGWEEGLRPGQYLKIPMKDPGLTQTIQDKKNDDALTGKHIVGAGETLYSIARKYKRSIHEIRAANPDAGNQLSIGQEINIPEAGFLDDKIEKDELFYEHVVSGKETLYGIARKYRISIDSLVAFNPGLTEYIFPGEVIRIPVRVTTQDFITHRVDERTRLRKIASKYSISVSAMKDANPSKGNRLAPGDLLRIPLGPAQPEKHSGLNLVVLDKPDDIPPEIVDSDSLRCYENMFSHRQELRVALMIPLYAEEVAGHGQPENISVLQAGQFRPFSFIQFYEGVLVALDELERQGLRVSLYVYDVDDKVSKTISVLQRPELPGMDMIIGPFFSRNFKLVSNFAEMFGIHIINPLTRRNEVLTNPYVIKVKPSYEAQPGLLAAFVEKYHRGANIIMVRNNHYQFLEESGEIRKLLGEVTPPGIRISNAVLLNKIAEYSAADTTLAPGELLGSLKVENRMVYTDLIENAATDSTYFPNGISEVIYSTDSIAGLIRHASVARKNLVLVLSNNEVFAPEILTRLNDLKDTFDISVVGMPEWGLIGTLETDYLLDLNVYFFSDSYYDYDDPGVKAFVEEFRRRFQTEPGHYAFEGYDLASYFLGALMRFGPDCSKCLPYFEEQLLKSRMRLSEAYPGGYENLYWNICRYRNYKMIRVPDLQ
jgi:LysM repeat protein